MPKEMLPVVDKPIIQYGVEEAIASGWRRDYYRDRPRQSRDGRPFRPAALSWSTHWLSARNHAVADRATGRANGARKYGAAKGAAGAGPCGFDGKETGGR